MAAPIVEVQRFDELYELGKSRVLTSSDKLTDLSFSPGYMADVFTGLPAGLAEEVLRVAVALHQKTFFATAEGDDLDKLADDHFGLPRLPGAGAIGTVTFSRPSPGANVLIPLGTLVETAEGLQFATTTAPILTGLTIDAGVQAVVPGQEGIVNASTIVVVAAGSGLPADVTVTNAERTSGGIERETDVQFRARIIDNFRTLRRGTPLALEVGALFVAGVLNAVVDESAYPPTVYIADAAGGATTALETAVDTELDKWRAAGIQVNVVGATVVFQDVALQLTFQAGFDTSVVRELARAAALAATNRVDIGETLFRSQIVAAVLGVSGIADVVVTDPSGDVVPAANEILRTEDARVTTV